MATKAAQKTRRRHGEGSIGYDAQRDRYVAQITRDGKRYKVSAKLERDCVAKLDALKAELRRGDVVMARTGLTVGDLLDHWLTVSLPNRGGKAAPGTRLNYSAYVRRLKQVIGSRPVAKLTVDDVEDAYRKIALGAGGRGKAVGVDYLNRVRITLRRAIADGERRGKVSDAVARVVDRAELPKALAASPKERIALTPDEMRTLITSSKDHRLHALIVVALTTGLRPGELSAIYWDALHLDATPPYVEVKRAVQRQGNNRFVVVDDLKNAGAYRAVALTPDAVEALRDHRRAQNVERLASKSWGNPDLVFASTRGTVLNPSNVRREFDVMTTAAGVPKIVPYETRHSVATALAESTLSTFQIVDILGHENDRMLNRVYRKKRKAIVTGAADVMANALGAKS